MPVPPAALVTSLARQELLQAVGPDAAQELAQAVGRAVGEACQRFGQRVQMAPGVSCAVDPTTRSGQVTGVGELIGAVPPQAEIRPEASRAATSAGILQDDRGSFAETVASLTATGLERFRSLARVLPGTPVAGGVTAAPMRLDVAVPAIRAELDALARGMSSTSRPAPPPTARQAARPRLGAPGASPQMGAHGGAPRQQGLALPPGFAPIVARVVGGALGQMASMLLIAPGIPVAGSVTAAPGRLI